MIAYFDTSALIPLVVVERGSARASRLWDVADRVVAASLVYPEARAALAQALRLGRLTSRQLRAAARHLDDYMRQVDVVELDESLARHAGDLAETHSLRGYDAVHLAAAERVHVSDLVMVAGGGALIDAARAVGLHTAAL